MITKSKVREIEHRVCQTIGLEIETLFWMKMENGFKFLEFWIGSHLEDDIKHMASLKEFWGWWHQMWYQRDLYFLNELQSNPGDLQDRYKKHNDPKRISERPNSVIMESYHRLIKGLQKQEIINF